MQHTQERAVAGPRPDGTAAGGPRLLSRLALVLASGLVLGGLTSVAQLVLPDALRPFANSASGWTLLTALIVRGCRSRALPSTVLGALGFVALVLGYQVVSTLRGFPTSEELFLVVAVVVGPVVGVAASWLRRTDVRAAIGSAVLAGIAVGESAYGLILVSQWTGWFFWTLIGVVGLALVALQVRRIRSPRDRVLAVALTLAVALAFFVAYSALGQVGL